MKYEIFCVGILNEIRDNPQLAEVHKREFDNRTWREYLGLNTDLVGEKEPFWTNRVVETRFGSVRTCVYQGKIYNVPSDTIDQCTPEERNLLIKHYAYRQHQLFKRIQHEIAAFDNFECRRAQRELIPDAVRLFVWQRDEGKCVQCGGCELLEFDHIIPRAEGGSSTERNVQLLCMPCNRSKGKRI